MTKFIPVIFGLAFLAVAPMPAEAAAGCAFVNGVRQCGVVATPVLRRDAVIARGAVDRPVARRAIRR